MAKNDANLAEVYDTFALALKVAPTELNSSKRKFASNNTAE